MSRPTSDESPFPEAPESAPEHEFVGYERRFIARFEDKAAGTYVKFGRHLVQRLDRLAFGQRLAAYQVLCKEIDAMMASGSTLSERVMLDLEEAASWLLLPSPNLFDLFNEADDFT